MILFPRTCVDRSVSGVESHHKRTITAVHFVRGGYSFLPVDVRFSLEVLEAMVANTVWADESASTRRVNKGLEKGELCVKGIREYNSLHRI